MGKTLPIAKMKLTRNWTVNAEKHSGPTSTTVVLATNGFVTLSGVNDPALSLLNHGGHNFSRKIEWSDDICIHACFPVIDVRQMESLLVCGPDPVVANQNVDRTTQLVDGTLDRSAASISCGKVGRDKSEPRRRERGLRSSDDADVGASLAKEFGSRHANPAISTGQQNSTAFNSRHGGLLVDLSLIHI